MELLDYVSHFLSADLKPLTKLTWQMSTPVSLSRAELATSIAESYRAILEDLGEDSNREGLKDSEFLMFTNLNNWQLIESLKHEDIFVLFQTNL